MENKDLRQIGPDEGFIVSHVKRWEPRNTIVGFDMEPRKNGSFVLSCDYDAAQSELSALREELAECNKRKAWWVDSAKTLDERLTAAEQRNAELIALLEHAYGAINENDGWKELCARILAVVQPAESGASE